MQQHYVDLSKYRFTDGRPMTDGLLDSTLTITRGTPPSTHWRESGLNAREPTPLYDVDFQSLEYRMPPAHAFFDQFSVPGAAAVQLDIFWVGSDSFIVCSARALTRLRAVMSAHHGRPGMATTHPVMNLFARHGASGARAIYLGVFQLASTRQRLRLSDTDMTACAAALRTACGERIQWEPVAGLQELCAGDQAEVHRIYVKCLKEDRALLNALTPVGWVEQPDASRSLGAFLGSNVAGMSRR